MRVLPLLALLVFLAACGGDDKAPAQAAKPTVTPFPTIDRADLLPGKTYTTQQFKPNVTLTMPEGKWIAARSDNPDHVEIEPEVTDPVDSSALAFNHITQVFDAEKGAVAPGEAVPAPADFAEWLTTHPHLRATKPKPVHALGLDGMSIDVRVKSGQPRKYKDCGKVQPPCVVMYPGGIEPIVYGGNSLGRFYVLEQPDGKQLVVEQYVEPASALKAQKPTFDELLNSAKVAGA
jgi:hypothetical protein